MNKKVYILTILVFVMAINAVFSQTTTKKLSYQAVVRNAANELVVNQNLSVEITILNANNVPQYKETHATVPTNQNGLLWLWVGDGTPTLGTMDNVVWKDATIKSVFTLPDGSTVEQNTPVTAMPYAYFADEVDTIFLQDYLTTHNYGNEDYVTHEELNDTLNHYYDTTHMKTAIHDTADVLRGLMVDAANDGKITIQKNNVEVDHFTVNQADDKAINITVPTTVAELTDADNYVTNAKLGDTLNAYYDTTDTKAAIHDTADVLRGLMVDAANDGKITIQKNNVEVDHFTVNQADDKAINITVPTTVAELTDADNYVTNAKLGDTLNAYYDTTDTKAVIHDTAQAIRSLIPIVPTNVSAFTNDAGYLTEHQSLEGYVTTVQMNDQHYLTSDSTVITTMQTNITNLQNGIKKNALCDSVNDCVHGWISDSTRMVIDSLNAYYDTTHMKTAIHDTANVLRDLMGDAANNATITIKKNNVEVDHFTLNQENDKAIDITVPTTVAELSDASNYVTNTKLSDTLNKYTTTNKVDTLLGAYYDTTYVNQTLKQYLKTGDLCDSIVKCEVIKDMRDSIQDNAAAIDLNTHQIEANAAAISGLQTKLHNDSLTLANKIRTDSTALVNRIVSDSSALADKMQSDSSALAGKMYNDSLTLAHRMDTVYKHLCDSVMNCSGIQTMQSNIAKNATDISNVQTKMHEDSLTLANKIRSDSTALVNRIVNDSTILYKALKDTAAAIRGDICDSATVCIKEALSDATSEINHAIDTIARYNIHDTASTLRAAIHDSLNSYKIKNCGDVINCINTELAEGTSATNHAIDSIAGNVIHDSIKTNIQANIDKTIHDSIVNNISSQIHDSIGNGTLTIKRNNEAVGTFKANQKNDQTLNIEVPAAQVNADWDATGTVAEILHKPTIPSTVAELTDHDNYATKAGNNPFSGNNNFSGKNHFTDSVTVPSNTTIPRPTTAEHLCTDNAASAVNICDLLAVFDSLTNRIKKLEDEVNALKNSAPPVFNSLTLSDSTATTIKATAAFTSTNLPITEYRYCYSKNSDMSSPSCTTSTSNSITLTGLDPYTRYYVTVSAANIAGVTTSTIENARTLAYAPTASTVDIAEHKPTGFQVNVSGLDFKEPAVSGTVRICYKLKGNDECVEDPTNTYSGYTACETTENATNSTNISEIISDIVLDQNYCVIVKVSNADSTTIYGPFSVTPANVTLTVTGTPSVTYHCGSPDVDPQYTATLSTGESADDYTFSWTGGTAASNNQTTYNPTLSETTTVTCTATHKTLNYELSGSVTTTVTIASVLPVISLCTEELTVTDKGSSNDISSVDWGDGNGFISATTVGHTYSTDGVYTITAKNAANCETTRQVVLGKVTVQPCTVSSTHVAQNLISGNDGKETVDANGKVVKVMDYDGHSYSVVQIGTQCWMAENLRTTHYGDGTAITNGSVASSAARYYIPKDGNSQDLNDSVFGLLYNWYAATRINNANDGSSEGKQGVCPQGWHVPTQSDWTTMETYVNGGTPLDHTIGNLSGEIAGKLAKGCAWTSSETEKASGNFAYSDRDAIGLGIVPAGRFNKNNTYTNYGSMAEFWVSYGGVNAYPYSWDITNDSPGTRLDYSNETNYKQYALSVRCVRDTVYSYYELSITPSQNSVCSGESITYEAVVTKDGDVVTNGITYSWSVGNPTDGFTAPSVNNTSSYVVTFTKAGNYTVACTTGGTTNNVSNSVLTVINGTPSFTVIKNGPTVTLDEPNYITEVDWGDNSVNDNESFTHTYEASGSYTIVASNGTTGCSTEGVVSVTLSPPTPPTSEPALSVTSVTANSMTVTPHFSGATTYTYCISINSDMSDAYCTEATTESTHEFTELTPNSVYYVQVTATNSGGETPSEVVPAHTLNDNVDLKFSCIVSGNQVPTSRNPTEWNNTNNNETGRSFGSQLTVIDSVKDADNNWYKVVQIGTQCWLKENMRATKYRDGTNTTDINKPNASTVVSDQQKYRYEPPVNNIREYGYLYNWLAATGDPSSTSSTSIIQGVCPDGWHVPRDDEWYVMETFVNEGPINRTTNSCGGSHACKLSKAGSNIWTSSPIDNSPGKGDCDASGFDAVPAGYLYAPSSGWGSYPDNENAYFWTASRVNNTGNKIIHRKISSNMSCVDSSGTYLRKCAMSVRCVRDAASPQPLTIDHKVSCVLKGTDDPVNTTHTSINTSTYSNDKVIEKGRSFDDGNIVILDSVSDFEGHWYEVVQIGTKCWLRENMRATKDSGGEQITLNNNDVRHYYSPNGNNSNDETYGLLYNYRAAMNAPGSGSISSSQGICPIGWHVPTETDWNDLLKAVNGQVPTSSTSNSVTTYNVDVRLFVDGNWANNTNGCTGYPCDANFENRNKSGFSALPAGFYSTVGSGGYYYFQQQAYFWSYPAKCYFIQYNNNKVSLHSNFSQTNGASVRCVRDSQ